jgi:hypothetical protein
MLVIACLVVGLSFVLKVREDQRVYPAGMQSLPLPPLCTAHSWFGVKCPGCGLTRSFIHLAHGDWSASWHTHHVGWVLALAVLLQIPYRIIGLRSKEGAPLGRLVPRLFGYFLIALLLGNWLLGVLGG